MHPLRYSILADENIHDELISFLRSQNIDVAGIKERNLRGMSDRQIIALAEKEKRIIITHDSDFGKLTYQAQKVDTGIIFIRPGHFNYHIDIDTLSMLLQTDLTVTIPFILVIERQLNDIKIRLRNL